MSTLKIETAGQSAQGSADMSLTGIVDAREFREKVNDQRDDITDIKSTGSKSPSQTFDASSTSVDVLLDIHKTLKRIESKLDK